MRIHQPASFFVLLSICCCSLAMAQTGARKLKRINRAELLSSYQKTDSFEAKKGALPEKVSRQPTRQPSQAVGRSTTESSVTGETDDSLTRKTLGLTLWRMRTATDSDEVQLSDTNSGEMVTPVRVKSNTVLDDRDRVRLTIEAPRDGYLYVIDHEKFANKSPGSSRLIFPTKRLHGGENRVTTGVTVEIPGIHDSPPYFTVSKKRPDLLEETLIVIISDQPIPGIRIGADASASEVTLVESQVTEWTTKWAVDFTRFDLDEAEGLSMRQSELQVATRTRALVHEDPKAQTVYYVPGARPGEPMMVTVPLVTLPGQ